MPGFTDRNSLTLSPYAANSSRTTGRGPMTLNCLVNSTFKNCGNSSKDVSRNHFPTLVIRGSSLTLYSQSQTACCSGVKYFSGLVSASSYMVRNFKIWIGRPYRPTRSCLKMGDPLDSALITMHRMMPGMRQIATTISENNLSNRALTNLYPKRPCSYSHEFKSTVFIGAFAQSYAPAASTRTSTAGVSAV